MAVVLLVSLALAGCKNPPLRSGAPGSSPSTGLGHATGRATVPPSATPSAAPSASSAPAPTPSGSPVGGAPAGGWVPVAQTAWRQQLKVFNDTAPKPVPGESCGSPSSRPTAPCPTRRPMTRSCCPA
ncbi:hypothetical protein [Phytohabitans rumicis]|uniref:hypothetical protein n=1 Tax=Phytohabitans rumicis TaxID=1076125 RepID=UPI001FE5B71C|nr:hypothetical protein [Phytohabitans rumicis]